MIELVHNADHNDKKYRVRRVTSLIMDDRDTHPFEPDEIIVDNPDDLYNHILSRFAPIDKGDLERFRERASWTCYEKFVAESRIEVTMCGALDPTVPTYIVDTEFAVTSANDEDRYTNHLRNVHVIDKYYMEEIK